MAAAAGGGESSLKMSSERAGLCGSTVLAAGAPVPASSSSSMAVHLQDGPQRLSRSGAVAQSYNDMCAKLVATPSVQDVRRNGCDPTLP